MRVGACRIFKPILVTEFGGIAYKKSEWEGWGYSGVVQGYCYTQLTDVEQEINGLLTYDRKPKVPVEVIKVINNRN
ncbi:hypothetical protein GCM10008018_07160 [Paenibacillus marchantiophytorum]|uniref:Uncharacterized protein n=1 Tax=Paenibacillus marchantiophytorum TaxID=1619310 RepID=A0ABQ2BPH1_9BACL|nr:hypothetical protein GCM10008018_07160 [Paenibacillus marchantiophytorum]